MTSADGIRKLGFRRWYERQLIESHVYLVTAFLSFILVMACLEAFNARGSGSRSLLLILLVLGAGALCMVALNRYLTMLGRAGRLAEKSVCNRCGVYGLLEVVGSGTAPDTMDPDPQSGGEILRVECRKCGNRWTIGAAGPG
jgi:hypothetical protein